MAQTLEELKVVINGDESPLVSSLRKAQSFATTAFAVIGGGLVTLGGLSLKAAGDFETMSVALETSFQGNTQQAKAAQKAITDFAAKTPFELNEVMRGFIKLKNMGLDPSEKALTSYGDTASAMGKSLNDMVEAVADAATGEFQRLLEFGIRASQQGDKVTFTFKGVSTTVKKDSKAIEDYLIKLGQVNFSGGMEKQSQTLNGMLSTLKDNFSLALNQMANDSGLLDLAKNAVKGISSAIAEFTPKIKDLFTFISENKTAVIGALTGVALVLAGLFVPAAIASVVTAAPLIILFGALAAAGFFLGKAWEENWGGMRDKLTDVWSKISPVLSELWTWLSTNIPAAMKTLWDGYNTNIKPFIDQLWTSISTKLLPALASLWQKIGPDITNAWNTASPILMKIAEFVGSVLVGAFAGLVITLTFVIDKFSELMNFISSNYEKIKQFREMITNIRAGGDWNVVATNAKAMGIPGFATGVQNFGGGLARVHKDELLVNLPKGTDVIPASQAKNMGNESNINMTVNNYDNRMDANEIVQQLMFRQNLRF